MAIIVERRWAHLFALEREAAPFRRLRPNAWVVVTGVGQFLASQAISPILAARPAGVVVAGFAGALRPGLDVGDVINPAAVVDYWDESTIELPHEVGTAGRIITVEKLAATTSDKQRLHEMYGADAVDMESAAVVRSCVASGVPVRCIRAITDTFDRALSPELVTLLEGGSPSPWRVACAVARKPWLALELRRLAGDTRVAAERLAASLAQFHRA